MLTCAEGVETDEQLAALRREGCSEVQGYLFGKPMPAPEFVRRYGIRISNSAPAGRSAGARPCVTRPARRTARVSTRRELAPDHRFAEPAFLHGVAAHPASPRSDRQRRLDAAALVGERAARMKVAA